MSTLDNLRFGLGRAWDNLAEGWSQLYRRTTHALTRFTPGRSGAVETVEEQTARQGSGWALLPAEVREGEHQITVRLEAPGMEAGDFEIDVVEGRLLVIGGEKRVEREEQRGHYHIMERAYGRFERAIPLPAEVDEGRTRAQYKKGVLRVELPKRSETRSARRIHIEEG